MPGNPLAALVSFELFDRPALVKMQGLLPAAAPLEAVLAEPVRNNSDRRNFLRGKLGLQDTSRWVWPAETQKSAQLASLIESNCLLVAREERSYYESGERIGIIPLYGVATGLFNFDMISVDQQQQPLVFEFSGSPV